MLYHLYEYCSMSSYIFCLSQSIPSTQEETNYFRLIKIDEDALFVEEEEFQNNRSFTLLHMREQGVRSLQYYRV